MRFEGDISIIKDIEQYIRRNTRHIPLKALPVLPPCDPAKYEATVQTRIYKVQLHPYSFDVCLRFDERMGTGRFDMKDANSQILFVKHPEIIKMLSRMDKMLVSRRNGDNLYKVKEIILVRE